MHVSEDFIWRVLYKKNWELNTLLQSGSCKDVQVIFFIVGDRSRRSTSWVPSMQLETESNLNEGAFEKAAHIFYTTTWNVECTSRPWWPTPNGHNYAEGTESDRNISSHVCDWKSNYHIRWNIFFILLKNCSSFFIQVWPYFGILIARNTVMQSYFDLDIQFWKI